MKRIHLRLELMTIDMMKQDSNREYNAYEWEKKIDRYAKNNAQFYKSPKNDIYKYDRFFVQYTADGINFFSEFAYHSCLSSNGFARVQVDHDSGDLMVFGFGPDSDQRAKNCEENRKLFRDNSARLGLVYSNNF